MEFAYTISGGAPLIKKFVVDDSAAIIAGVPVISDAESANGDGVLVIGTTTGIGMIGVSLDGASSTAAQVTTGDNAGSVSIPINPDAVYRSLLTGTTEAGAEDTAIVIITQVAADLTGLAPTTVTDEFTVWGYSGANNGISRRCDAANSVLMAFPNDIAAGDQWLQTSTVVAEATQWPVLSNLKTQICAAADVDADRDNLIVVEMELNDISNSGRTNSFVYVVAADHAFQKVGTVAT